jgi:ribosomal protein L11 methyltransferase
VIRLAVRVRREDAEVVLAELLELAPGGVEEVQLGEEAVEYAVYGAPGELPELPALDAAVGDTPVEVSSTEIPDDWSERWKHFHRPVLIEPPRRMSAMPGESGEPEMPGEPERKRVPALHVRPPWEAPSDRRDAEEIVIDPGQAFGTGAHATTRLCLEALLELSPGGPLVDLGSGSGVLGIAAARLGWSPVLALDLETTAVEATQTNARRNGVTLQAQRYDLRSDLVERSVAGTVTANLLAPLLVTWAGRLREAPELPDRVIASGLLRTEADRIAEAFAPLGLRLVSAHTGGEWAALVLGRGSS